MVRFVGKKKRILAEGMRATAVVTAVREKKILGMSEGNNAQDWKLDLTLTVRPVNEPSFEAHVSNLYYKWASPVVGTQFWVRYDPSDKTHVVIEE